LRDLFNVLQILKEKTGCDYTSYYTDMKTELYKLFNKYETKFGAARSQRRAVSLQAKVIKNRHGK
jgi:hypothetical protein